MPISPASYKSQRQLFATTDTRLRAFVTENADLPWFDRSRPTPATPRSLSLP